MQNNGKISAFSRRMVVIPFLPEKTLLRASSDINVSNVVCVNVCGVSAVRLRHVSMDADVVFGVKMKLLFFQERSVAICVTPEIMSFRSS